jgi:hypothetical protein
MNDIIQENLRKEVEKKKIKYCGTVFFQTVLMQ